MSPPTTSDHKQQVEATRASARTTAGDTFSKLFGADLRSVSLFRIALASLILIDLVLRSRHLTAHYTDAGVLPRDALSGVALSFHALGGSYVTELLLFCTTGVFAAFLLVGVYARVASFGCWLLMTSLHARNPLLLDGGDALVRLLLLWGVFLPLGARWSLRLGRFQSREHATGTRCYSLATVALTLQFILFYWGGGLCKSGPEWTSTGNALELVFQNEYWNRPLGNVLSESPALLRVLTPATIIFELLGPLLLLVPVWHGPIRMLTILSFWIFQLSLGSTIQLNLFPFISTLTTLFLIPTWFWERLWWPRRDGANDGETSARTGRELERARHAEHLTDDTNELGGTGTSAVTARSRGRFGTAVVAILMLLMVFQNLTNLGLIPTPSFLTQFEELSLIKQRWQMYARPPQEDVSFEISGRRESGVVVGDAAELFSLSDSSELSQLHASYRFKYYLERLLRDPRHEALQSHYLRWLCGEIDGASSQVQGDDPVVTLQLEQVVRPILPHAEPRPPATRSVVCKISCRGAN